MLPPIRQRLRQHGQPARPHLRCHWFLMCCPRESRSEAIRFLSLRWQLPPSRSWWWPVNKGMWNWCRVSLLPWCRLTMIHAWMAWQQQRVYFANRSCLPGVLEGLSTTDSSALAHALTSSI